MSQLRVLILDGDSLRKSAVVTTLQALGVSDILQARTSKEASALVHLRGEVDIAVYDASHSSIGYLAFLRRASKFGRVRALIVYGELSSVGYRAVEEMAAVSGLELLGCLSRPLRLNAMRDSLRLYEARCPSLKKMNEAFVKEDIRRGLAEGEFRAYFLPRYILASDTMIGADVLIRWQHPTKGLLLPKEFLANILAHGLSDCLFRQIFEQGLRLQRLIKLKKKRLVLSFKLHTSQFKNEEFIPYIQDRLSRYALSGVDLTFELAEYVLLDTDEHARAGLRRLRRLGCGLAVDDFDVGASSFKQLCLLPITQIKLDERFARGLRNTHGRALVANAQDLALALNIDLVVKGVSCQHEHSTFLDMGCLCGQGVYYARPMDINALLAQL